MLNKSITILGGINAEYWRLQEVTINRTKQEVRLTLFPVIGGLPIAAGKKMYRIADVVYENGERETTTHYTDFFAPSALEGNDIYAVSYQYIKNNIPEFLGATDVYSV